MIRLNKMLFGISIHISILFIAASCTLEKPAPEIIRPVKYEEVYASGGNRTRSFSGVAQASMESNLSFKVPGTIKKVGVKVGDKVKSGTIIAELDSADFKLEVQQVEAALTQAKAQERHASASFERGMQLYEDRNIAKSDLDASRAAYESAQALVKAMEKQLELARRKLDYAVLRAPVAGSIAQVNLEANENAQAGKTVVVLTSGAETEVRLSIPEVLIARIREGAAVTVIFDAIPGKQFKATVTEVGVTSSGTATTFPVTVTLDTRESGIRPGMAASITFQFDTTHEQERFIVPSIAVSEDRQGRYVYIVESIPGEEGYGIVKRKKVTVGNLTAAGMEIFEGLEDGDKVVTAGVSRITAGQKVKI